jgi:hypothetical protein
MFYLSTSDLRYDKSDSTFYADSSDLHGKFNSVDPVCNLVSHKSGNGVVMNRVKMFHDDEGDVQFWKYEGVIRENQKTIKMVIFND